MELFVLTPSFTLFHVFKLAPTQCRPPAASRALALDVRDVVVLDVISCPLLQGIMQDFLGQAMCIFKDHSIGPRGFLHFLFDVSWRRPGQQSLFWHEAFFTFMPLLNLKCGRKWESLLWFDATHVMWRSLKASNRKWLLQHLWESNQGRFCPRDVAQRVLSRGHCSSQCSPSPLSRCSVYLLRQRRFHFGGSRKQNNARLGTCGN